MTTLVDLVVKALSSNKKPLINSQIKTKIQSMIPYATSGGIDNAIHKAVMTGRAERRQLQSGRANFAYSIKFPSVATATYGVLSSTLRTSSQVHRLVQNILPEVTVSAVDTALYQLANNGQIVRSKTPMTDNNASSQSKFVYSK